MTTLREAAQQALEALEYYQHRKLEWDYADEATITDLRAALAQQEQEPVTWGVDWGRDGDQSCCTIIKRHADGIQEVVAVEYGPPRREWVSLTEEEIEKCWDSRGYSGVIPLGFARAIEQALKEKNHE